MSSAKQYATEIEHILCSVFDCDRYGFGGIVDSDFVRANPYVAIASGLAFKYAKDLSKEDVINSYLGEYGFYLKYDLDTLVKASNGEIVPGWEYDQGKYDSGEEIVKSIINALQEIVK